jgi:uncharacterized Zn-finger protein
MSGITASSTQRRYEITTNDLPLSCPMKGQEGWNAHPKVYLDIEEKGEVLCPYCGALYVLVDKA